MRFTLTPEIRQKVDNRGKQLLGDNRLIIHQAVSADNERPSGQWVEQATEITTMYNP